MAQCVIFRFVSLLGWSELLDPLICYEVFFCITIDCELSK